MAEKMKISITSLFILWLLLTIVAFDHAGLNASEDSYISIDQYYESAVPVNDPTLPKQLKYRRWTRQSGNLYIFTQKGEARGFSKGIFTAYFFDDKYNGTLKEIFSNDGYNSSEVENFFLMHRNENRVQLYKDGFLLLKDRRRASTYVMPLSEQAILKILDL